MVKQLILTLLLSASSLAVLASSKVTTTGKYVYIVTPFNEMTSADRREAIGEAHSFIVAELDKLFPVKERDRVKAIRQLEEKKRAIDEVIKLTDQYMKNDAPGVNRYELMPSALLVLMGGGFQKQFMLTVSGSFNIGLVIMPSAVRRINKADPRDVRTYHTFECSVVLLPVGDIGMGMKTDDKKTPKFRAGAGLIFGDMISPNDFFGLTAGPSVNFSLFKFSFQGKVFGVIDTKGLKFVVASLTTNSGDLAALEIHANVGFAKPVASFMGAYDRVSGIFVGNNSAYGSGAGPYNPYYDPNNYGGAGTYVPQPYPGGDTTGTGSTYPNPTGYPPTNNYPAPVGNEPIPAPTVPSAFSGSPFAAVPPSLESQKLDLQQALGKVHAEQRMEKKQK